MISHLKILLLSVVCYLASILPRERVHQLLNAVVRENRRVEEELPVRQLISIDKEAVRHQGVPVVELAELQRNAVPVLELGAKQQWGIKFQFQQVSAEVLHVFLYDDFYCLT